MQQQQPKCKSLAHPTTFPWSPFIISETWSLVWLQLSRKSRPETGALKWAVCECCCSRLDWRRRHWRDAELGHQLINVTWEESFALRDVAGVVAAAAVSRVATEIAATSVIYPPKAHVSLAETRPVVVVVVVVDNTPTRMGCSMQTRRELQQQRPLQQSQM